MERISVAIRVRPATKDEFVKGNHWVIEENKITLCNCYGAPVPGYSYAFDRLFGPSSKNLDVYTVHAKDVVLSAMQGFNGTVFAYGQTSSGKTHTMQGSDEQPGLIRLAIRDVFDSITENSDREFLVRVSYMEIYNEEINDLLAPENRRLQIHENFERGPFVAGLREEIVNGPEQVLDFLMLGEAHRHFGETNMNIYSSRSHTIFRMVIESRDKDRNSDAVRVSTLNMVDLAGSERVAKTGAGGVRLKEGTHINKSLMTLGNVIHKLSDGVKGGHIPYRDSKLTRILQSALDGNAKTAIICTITPDEIHVDESRGTLLFASRAKKVATCAHVNEILTDAALLKRQKREIEELRQKLLGLQSDDFEKQLLKLRNDLLKYELEKEKLALELEEERRSKAERERQIKEQEQKIENLSSLVLSANRDDKNARQSNRRETWSPQRVHVDAPKEFSRSPLTRISFISTRRDKDRTLTPPPAFDALIGNDANDLRTPDSFACDENTWTDMNKENIADEDAWNRLNNVEDDGWVNRNREKAVPAFTPCVKFNEVELLEFELKELQLQYEDLQCRYNTKNEEEENVKKKLELLSETFDKTKEELETLQKKNAVLLETNKDLEARQSVKEQQFTEDKRQLLSQLSRIEELNSHIAYLEKQNALSELEIANDNEFRLEQEVLVLTEVLNGLAEERDRNSRHLTALSTENASLVEENKRIASLVEKLKVEQQAAVCQADKLSVQNLELSEQVSDLLKEIERIQESKGNLEKAASLQENNAKHEYQKLLVVVAELKQHDEQLQKCFQNHQTLGQKIKQQLSDAVERNALLEELSKGKDAELHALQTTLLAVEKKCQETVDASNSRISMLEEDFDGLRVEKDRLSTLNKSKDAELYALQTKLSAAKKECQETVDASNRRISTLEEDLDGLRVEKDRLSTLNKSKDDELQELLTRISSLEKKDLDGQSEALNLSTERVLLLEKELDVLKQEKDHISSTKETEIQALQAKLLAVEKKYNDERIASNEEHSVAIGKLAAELNELRAEKEELSSFNKGKDEELQTLSVRMSTLEKKYEEEQTTLQKSRERVSTLEGEVDGLRAERDHLSNTVATLVQDNQDFLMEMKKQRFHVAQELSRYVEIIAIQQETISKACSEIDSLVK